MANNLLTTSAVTFLIHFLLLSDRIQSVWSYYCEWDLCGSDQYCCGDNLCCEYVYSLWYFWVAILFVVIVLSACGGLFRYCYYHSSHLVDHRINSYSPVPNMGPTEDRSHFMTSDSSQKPPSYSSLRDPPPPYSSVVSSASSHHHKHGYDGNTAHYP